MSLVLLTLVSRQSFACLQNVICFASSFNTLRDDETNLDLPWTREWGSYNLHRISDRSEQQTTLAEYITAHAEYKPPRLAFLEWSPPQVMHTVTQVMAWRQHLSKGNEDSTLSSHLCWSASVPRRSRSHTHTARLSWKHIAKLPRMKSRVHVRPLPPLRLRGVTRLLSTDALRKGM
eukprot:1161689-Pelagomonas_calceolata.AAC.5